MKINITPLRQWLGFTRKERRASLVLISLIAIVVCVRLLIPSNEASAKYMLIEKEVIETDTVKHDLTESPPAIAGNVQSRAVITRLIEINSCDSTELLSLRGIGTVLSGRIIRFRNLLGGYASKEQLQEVYGLTPETFDMIKDRIIVDTTLIDKINVNTADFRRFSRLPYFERNEINNILRYRNINGQIHSIGELIENNILNEDKVVRVKPYMDFSR